VYEDARTQELAAYLREHRVSALLDIPIVTAGNVLGVGGVDGPGVLAVVQSTTGPMYYAAPVEMQLMHINYWIDMLQDAGERLLTLRT